MGLLNRRWVRVVTTSALAVAVVSFVPITAAVAAPGTLPAGTQITNTISSPADGASVPNSGAVTVTGTGAVGQTPASPSTNLIYVIDRSGSTSSSASGCPGGSTPDVNGDGLSNTVLDCELAAALALNNQAITAGTVAKVGVVSFDTNAATVHGLIVPTDPAVVSSIKSITVGGSTNFGAGVNQACGLAGTTTPTTIVFLSDGVANTGPNAVTAANACGSNITIRTFAVGSGSSCTNTGGGRGSLEQIAVAKGSHCTLVTNLSSLPTVISAIADPKVSGVTGTVDGTAVTTGFTLTPTPPAGSVAYSWNVTGLTPGTHTLCTIVSGYDVGGAGVAPNGVAKECRNVIVAAVVPAVSVNDTSMVEGASGTFTVSLSAPTTQTVTVDYATANDTATAGADYTAATGTLTFAPGQTSKTVVVSSLQDTIYEGTERFVLNLSHLTNATLADGQGIGTITDDESPPTITIVGTPGTGGTADSPNVSVPEGDAGCTAVGLVVKLSNASTSDVTVDYTVGGGTATNGTDYVGASGTIVVPAGQTSVTIPGICVKGDLIDEDNETFNVALSNPRGGTLPSGGATSVVTIIDDDNPPTITIVGTPGTGGNPDSPDVFVTEGNGPACTSVTLTINLSGPSSKNVVVTYGTGGSADTATAGTDYTVATGSVTFLPGETSKTVTLCVTGDIINEPNETFTFTASTPTSSAKSTITIVDDDPPVTLSVSDSSVVEGNTGTRTMTFTVTRSRVTPEAISVNWKTADGSAPVATAGTDYLAGTGSVGWAADDPSLTKTFTVTVIGDLIDEPNEMFNVVLSGQTGGTVGLARPVGVGTIIDDDRNGTFSCQSTGLRLLGLGTFIANPAYTPCADGAGSLINLPINLLVSVSAKVITATSDSTPDNPAATAPAVNDVGQADSRVAGVSIVLGGLTITADAVSSHAEARCTAPLGGVPQLAGSTTLVNLRINGRPVVVNAAGFVSVPGVATVWINKTIVTGTHITQRAIWVQGAGLLSAVEVVVAEARAGYTGNPCAS